MSEENKEISSELENAAQDVELSDDELDEASGGIIIVGGTHQKNAIFRPNGSAVSLNPQPLPPSQLNIGTLNNLGKMGSH